MLKTTRNIFLTLAMSSTLFASGHNSENEIALFGKSKTPQATLPPQENINGKQTGENPTPFNCLNRNSPYVFASFLYWANQMTEGVVTSQSTPVGANGIAFELKDKTLPTQYNPGFKVGLGYTLKQGTWSPMVLWTYMHSNPSKAWTVADNSLICDFALPVTQNYQTPFSGNILPGANNVKADWKLNFNSIDLEMGKSFVVSDDFAVRPFGCVKLACVDNKLEVNYTDIASTIPILGTTTWPDQKVTKENKAWLVGPRVGVNNYFKFVKDFGFVASVATSLLAVIDEPTIKAEVYAPSNSLFVPAGASVGNEQKRSETNIQPQFDLFLGFDWGHCFKNATYMNVAVGYEMQWYAAVINAQQSLNMYGLTLDILFDF